MSYKYSALGILYIWCLINANIITSGKINSDIPLPEITLPSLQSLRNLVLSDQERDQPKSA